MEDRIICKEQKLNNNGKTDIYGNLTGKRVGLKKNKAQKLTKQWEGETYLNNTGKKEICGNHYRKSGRHKKS